MKPLPLLTLSILMMASAAAFAQSEAQKPEATKPSVNPLSDYTRHVYDGVQKVLLRSAEKMPEENYNFKPTDTVRSYGQVLGHVADAQYLFCSIALGEKIRHLKSSRPRPPRLTSWPLSKMPLPTATRHTTP